MRKVIISACAALIATSSSALAYVDWDHRGQGGWVPQDAIEAGYEANGTKLYSCVADYQGGRHPGKVRAGFGGCNIPYGGREITIHNYSVLIGSGVWVQGNFNNIAHDAVPAGYEANGQPLYICIAQYNGGLHPGKIRYGFNGCNIPYGGREHTVPYYEVLANQ